MKYKTCLALLVISSISLPLLGEESSRTLLQKAELDAPEIKMGDSVSQVRDKVGAPYSVSSPYGKKTYIYSYGRIGFEEGKVVRITEGFNEKLREKHEYGIRKAKRRVAEKKRAAEQRVKAEKHAAEQRVKAEKYAAEQRAKGLTLIGDQWLTQNQIEGLLREFNVEATANAYKVMINNKSYYDWENVVVTVNDNKITGGYIYKTDKMKAGYEYTIGMSHFFSPDGEKYNTDTHRVRRYSITCDTEYGKKEHDGTWEWSEQPKKPKDGKEE